jgi:hypothetical protein
MILSVSNANAWAHMRCLLFQGAEVQASNSECAVKGMQGRISGGKLR